jgi:hypothetical protein
MSKHASERLLMTKQFHSIYQRDASNTIPAAGGVGAENVEVVMKGRDVFDPFLVEQIPSTKIIRRPNAL